MLTRAEMSLVMDKVFAECQALREAGQKEYAHDQANAFGNFERIAAYLHLSREQVLLTYAIKHLDGIVAWVNGHRSQREDVRGRINDLIVYMGLLRGMVEDVPGPMAEGGAGSSAFDGEVRTLSKDGVEVEQVKV